jgi:hypothetical protein
MNGRQLRAILAVVRALSPEELDKFVALLPQEFSDLALRLVNVSGQILNGPLHDFLEGCEGLTGAEAEERFLEHLLRLDQLTRMTITKERGRQASHDNDRSQPCPN